MTKVIVASAMILAGVVFMTGCSAVSPEESAWDGGEASFTGTVTNRGGTPLEGVTVYMWSEVGVGQTETSYEFETDANGRFQAEDVELGGTHYYAHTYEVYVNRMKDSEQPLDDDYTTYYGTVTVEKNENCEGTFVLSPAPDPGDPSSMFE